MQALLEVTGMNKNLSLKLAPKSKIDGVIKPPGSKVLPIDYFFLAVFVIKVFH